jgi:phosphatidylethanolamine/phosphatidyl-N-methylethanolamine N-methyltransferase
MRSGDIAYGDFLRGLVSNPKGVSAPTPSSRALARAIAAQVDIARSGVVLELGPGTGVVTNALLQHGIAGKRLIAIEQTGYFAGLMRTRFPAVQVVQGDALAFEDHIPSGATVAAIVSGLPLLQFPLPVRQSLLRRALACQSSGGKFVQLSYSWRPPVAPEAGMMLEKTMVWRNFPPAHVWTYHKS